MESTTSPVRQWTWLVLFSIAMGLLEAAVVVYLRAIYYPTGFVFPLTTMDLHHVGIEILREAATVVMLAGVGILAGRNANQRLAFFLTAFSVWDIFYYVFLKVFLDWPDSWLTWDILFLIPVPWIGPVLSPVIICITMLLLAAALYYRDHQNPSNKLQRMEWVLLILGSLVVILSWTWDYFLVSRSAAADNPMGMFSNFIPKDFMWWLFILGELLLLAGVLFFWRRTGSILSPQRRRGAK